MQSTLLLDLSNNIKSKMKKKVQEMKENKVNEELRVSGVQIDRTKTIKSEVNVCNNTTNIFLSSHIGYLNSFVKFHCQ